MGPKESTWVQTCLLYSKLFAIGAKKVSKGFKWCQKVLKKNTPQVQNSVKKCKKLIKKCLKLREKKGEKRKEKVILLGQKKVAKIAKKLLQTKKGPKKLKKE